MSYNGYIIRNISMMTDNKTTAFTSMIATLSDPGKRARVSFVTSPWVEVAFGTHIWLHAMLIGSFSVSKNAGHHVGCC